MRQQYNIHNAPHVDTIVSAQIPDPVAHPMLYATIKKCIMHGPCGPEHPNAPCMVNGKCSKHLPKDFCAKTHLGHLDPTEEDVFNYGLHLIQNILMESGKILDNSPDMPLPQQNWDILVANHLLQEQLAYDSQAMTYFDNDHYSHFNPEQKLIFDEVVKSAKNHKGNIFFLHSAGGCGETYICSTMAAAIHADGKVALCIASSAIAALLLHGGQTLHSHFKIPIPINDTSICNITKGD